MKLEKFNLLILVTVVVLIKAITLPIDTEGQFSSETTDNYFQTITDEHRLNL